MSVVAPCWSFAASSEAGPGAPVPRPVPKSKATALAAPIGAIARACRRAGEADLRPYAGRRGRAAAQPIGASGTAGDVHYDIPIGRRATKAAIATPMRDCALLAGRPLASAVALRDALAAAIFSTKPFAVGQVLLAPWVPNAISKLPA